jgi:predicted phage baseplate assembly protein
MRRPNPPGRDHLDLRVGTHGAFKAAMLRPLGDQPALAGLTARDDDEPAIALLDGWAAALDVLTFYTERHGQDAFLRTATERAAVLQLARAVGYELRPGVAATTHLAFTMSATPEGPDRFPIPVGTRVQSVPGAGELPQMFETVEPVETRPVWNAMPVVCAVAGPPTVGDVHVLLAGVTTGLVEGDMLLVLGGGPVPTWGALRRARRVSLVDPVAAAVLDPEPLVAGHTAVDLDEPLANQTALGSAVTSDDRPGVIALRQRAGIFGWNAPPWCTLPVGLRVGELAPTFGIEAKVQQQISQAVQGDDSQAKPLAEPASQSNFLVGAYADRQSSWADTPFPAGTTVVHLDQPYPRVVAGSWVVFSRVEDNQTIVAIRRVASVTEVPVTDFGLSGRCTRLTISGGDIAGFSPRSTVVLCQGENLPLALRPLATTLGPTAILDLDRGGSDLADGRTLIVDGDDPAGGPRRAEVVRAHVVTPLGQGRVRLTLEQPTQHDYVRTSVRVLGNVAKATHGESRAEVLGSGDARVPFARFALTGVPLTHVPGATATGARSTLAIWVNGVRWQEVPSLHGQAPDAEVYTVRSDDEGALTVAFGDGRTGSRLPTGQDNVVATYRVGSGRAAELPRGRLTLLVTRPLGVQDVTNPVPADGSDDPESREQARRNAPLSVQTLGRIVSRADYEGFARTFAGVAKARADIVWDGEREVVVITLAGPDGEPVAGETVANLAAAIDKARQSTIPVVLRLHTEVPFAVTAALARRSRHRFVDVEAAVRRAVEARYAFTNVDFAVPVTRGDLLATMQALPGVEGVVLTSPAATVTPRPGRADAAAAGGLAPAELAVLGAITLSEVAP